LGINLYHDAGTQALMSDHGRMQTPRPDIAGLPSSGPGVADPPLHPRITSFRTRRSTLSGGQQAAWERLWPEMGRPARDADGPAPRLDTESWFGRSAPVVLEIGSGTGVSRGYPAKHRIVKRSSNQAPANSVDEAGEDERQRGLAVACVGLN